MRVQVPPSEQIRAHGAWRCSIPLRPQHLTDMKRVNNNPFLKVVRDKYFDELGLGHYSRRSKGRWMKNRKRPFVEARAALFNAVSPFASRVECASVFQKDHATVLHAIKNHNMYLAYSAHYGECYEKATRIVMETAKQMNVYPIGRYRHYINSQSELETLQLTLNTIQQTINDVKDRIDKNQNPVREYRRVLDTEEQ